MTTPDHRSLNDLLAQLQTALDDAPGIDGEARARLAQLDATIRARLDPAVQTDSMPDSLDGLVVEFEARHPRIARTIEELVETLARMGI